MIEPVPLGGKWWAHTGDCSAVKMPPHVHYGQNVILEFQGQMVPDAVLHEYYLHFGDPNKVTA